MTGASRQSRMGFPEKAKNGAESIYVAPELKQPLSGFWAGTCLLRHCNTNRVGDPRLFLLYLKDAAGIVGGRLGAYTIHFGGLSLSASH